MAAALHPIEIGGPSRSAESNVPPRFSTAALNLRSYSCKMTAYFVIPGRFFNQIAQFFRIFDRFIHAPAGLILGGVPPRCVNPIPAELVPCQTWPTPRPRRPTCACVRIERLQG